MADPITPLTSQGSEPPVSETPELFRKCECCYGMDAPTHKGGIVTVEVYWYCVLFGGTEACPPSDPCRPACHWAIKETPVAE